MADLLCGFRCSKPAVVDRLGGSLADITSPIYLRQIDADLPLLIIGGERDRSARAGAGRLLVDACAVPGCAR
ncbi:hypothetical protein P4234_19280 [Pseudomonas aeruginosa]|nr:hypothetical protein [Pseudomonas aeruginosa]